MCCRVESCTRQRACARAGAERGHGLRVVGIQQQMMLLEDRHRHLNGLERPAQPLLRGTAAARHKVSESRDAES